MWFHRLEDERAEVERQKEYFAKLRAEFRPDGGRVRVCVGGGCLLTKFAKI